jgi:protease-4
MLKKRRRLLLLLLLLLVVAIVWRSRFAGPTIAAGSYLHVRLEGTYVEEAPTDLLGRLFGRTPHTLIEVLEALRLAALDARIAGAIIEIGALDIGWAKTEDLRAALAAFREADKPVYATLVQEGAASNQQYFLGSVASRIYVAPATTAPLIGLAAQHLFLGGVWEKLDVSLHVEKIGDYKTAGDMLVNKAMSPQHREMANALLDSVNHRFVTAIAKARDLDDERVQALIDEGLMSGEQLAGAGLANGERYVAEVVKDDADDASLVELEDYQGVDAGALGRTATHTVAVVYGVGPIVLGESSDSLSQGPIMGSTTIVEAIEDAAKDDDVKAIVFRIDSPGGSALASDLIWKATREAQAKKPLIASMSDVAASGGYYVAAGANRILAQATTLTGSIGVVFAKPNVTGLLNRLGVTTETLTRGRYARLNDITAPLDEALRAKIVEEIGHVYEEFVDRVATGRRLSPERVNEIGRGRVWTGAQAVDVGLVDEIGGLHDAVRAAKVAANIPETEEVNLVFYPRHKTLVERMIERLGTAVIRVPREIDALRTWTAAMGAFPLTQPAVLAIMPEFIVIR